MTTKNLARKFFLDRQADFWARELKRKWAVRDVRARVVAVIDETRDVKTFVLAPNRNWRGHRAGQWLPVDVELDGVRTRRCYSISSAPDQTRISITVKRVPGGRVSSYLHEHIGRGAVLDIGQAAGDFVMPEVTEAKLTAPKPPGPRPRLRREEGSKVLFISGGSGITPVMSMLRALDARRAVADVAFVHYCRGKDDVIFASELTAIACRTSLRLMIVGDDEREGGFDERRLARAIPDFAARDTYLCGPPGLMTRVEAMWQAAGASANLRRERFSLATAPVRDDAKQPIQLRLGRSQRELGGDCATTLLEQLERAGERPPNGCRIGICHTCKQKKTSGTVRNLVTGAVSSVPDEDIQLCVSVPCSDVELGL